MHPLHRLEQFSNFIGVRARSKTLFIFILLFSEKLAPAQIAQHVQVDNAPVNWSDPVRTGTLITIPLVLLILGLIWKAKRKVNFKITACGNTSLPRKELKHLSHRRNIVDNRKVIYKEKFFDN